MVNEVLAGKQETLMGHSVLAGRFPTGLISSIFLDVIEIPGDGDTSAARCPASSPLVFLLSRSGSRARVRGERWSRKERGGEIPSEKNKN